MECWKDIKGYEGLYMVSTNGRVRRMPGGRVKALKILSPRHNRDGYIEYKLSKNGEKKVYSAHRLVAIAFIPNPLSLPEVNHIDKNRTNNTVSNLEWCTSSYNKEYIWKDRVSIYRRRDVCEVIQYDLRGNILNSYRNTREASNCTDIIRERIILCTEGKIPQAGGYIWKLKEKYG